MPQVERLVRCAASLYQAELMRIVRHKLEGAAGDSRGGGGRGGSGGVNVTNSVMELRNICNHPYTRWPPDLLRSTGNRNELGPFASRVCCRDGGADYNLHQAETGDGQTGHRRRWRAEIHGSDRAGDTTSAQTRCPPLLILILNEAMPFLPATFFCIRFRTPGVCGPALD